MKRINKPILVNGPNGEIVKVVWLPEQRVRFDIKPGPAVIEMAFLTTVNCNVQVRYGIKKDISNSNRVTATSIVRELLSLSRVPSDEEIIKKVLTTVPGSHFDSRDLSWHKWKWKKRQEA